MPNRKMLGVIGGVGPLSTAYFMETLINKTDAVLDQEHVNMIVLNHCEIPDRTAYILDNTKENPILFMKEDAIKLQNLECNVIVLPCNTAHYFYDELQAAVTIPIINMIEETAIVLKNENAKRVGIMATNGTIATRLFQDDLSKRGIEPIVPNAQNQQFVMDIIYNNVKAGVAIDLESFRSVVNEFRLHGCDKVILGCTELSILKREYSLGDFYVDSLEVLCERAIEACGHNVKYKY